MTRYEEIRVAPAVLLVADKAAFFGCGFYGMQDTVGDLVGRHYFQQCFIKGAIDFIWGGGQSIYQSCIIEVMGVTTATASNDEVNRGLIAGYITAQGRGTEKETSGFVFSGCAIFGPGKAFLGRAYGGYSRVVFSNTNMANVIVPQGWDSWTHPKEVNKVTFVEVNCKGPGANKKGRVAWEKNLSPQDVSYFINHKTFLNKDGWIESLPPHLKIFGSELQPFYSPPPF
ncbi:PREDICTED: probable pectinesterase 29 [Camelina sativa]|uniref:pectinesterase n=1 Tax=Camelina sativa TaxID=90675 RepID=A0ABM1R2P0_CAMSA|nr:PREDICTED: probable pectinesterase 29 [Camelina sativa]